MILEEDSEDEPVEDMDDVIQINGRLYFLDVYRERHYVDDDEDPAEVESTITWSPPPSPQESFNSPESSSPTRGE